MKDLPDFFAPLRQFENMSLSHGTLRMQDLVPALLDAVENLEPPFGKKLRSDIESVLAEGIKDPDELWSDHNDMWGSEDIYFIYEEMFDKLNELAPPGFYFGSHPGDSSDVGFWKLTPDMMW